MGLFADIWGTVKSTFQISIGGVKLKNSSGNLEVRRPNRIGKRDGAFDYLGRRILRQGNGSLRRVNFTDRNRF